MYKLKNTLVVVSTACLYYNMYLIEKVYFRCGVMSILPQQEYVLKQIYEPVILQKLGLSENFLRAVLYSRKTALGVGLLAPRTIIDMLAMKLYLEYQRAKDRTSLLIQIIEVNVHVQYRYSKSIIETDRIVKLIRITWSDKI